MPRPCSICVNSNRTDIEALLLEGTPLRTIADHHGVSKTALIRHRDEHLPDRLLRARDAEEIANADGLLARLRELTGEAQRIGGKAEAEGDFRAALAAVRELVRIVELQAKLTEQLGPETVVNVAIDQRTQQVILSALEPHPEARIAVAEALIEVEGYEE